ncbi:MAG: A/G-specific adenine glycosylase [Candidatus Hydrogenedentes bacterium]|nr:A/G-specific adenine glycosylase [Candidatus Hydrogenedentota bacterium]
MKNPLSDASPPRLAPALARAFRAGLPAWFEKNRRAFPWRARRTPYRVWVSEIMLQQTRADQAVPYYRRFLRRFPTLAALAAAPRREVLRAWQGLGYYARARHLHEAARLIRRRHGGRFPSDPRAIRALPGVGDYTAAAIGSLAFGHAAAVLDGNVARVLSRVMALEEPVHTRRARLRLEAWARELLVPGRAGLSNEALMELGALVCLPRRPACPACPLGNVCRARAGGKPEAYPVKKRRAPVPHKVVGAAVTLRRDGRILIAQRKDSSMLGGLWEFPGGGLDPGETMDECIARELKEEMGVRLEVGPLLTVVHHAYSHFTIELHAHWARIRSGRPRAIHCADFAWVRTGHFGRYPFSRADHHIIEALRAPAGRAARKNLISTWFRGKKKSLQRAYSSVG